VTDWRSVPEPESLDGVLRTAGGMPVPWAAAWTSEVGYEARPDPLLQARGVDAECMFEAAGGPGEGHPKLAMISPARQRESVLGTRCQVCRCELAEHGPPWDPPLWLADLRSRQTSATDVLRDESGRQVAVVGGRARPLIYEPWLCEPCLLYSLRACKGLLAMRRRGALTLWRVRDVALVLTFERPVDPPAGGGEIRDVVTYVKLALTDAVEVHPFEVLRAARPDRSTLPASTAEAAPGGAESMPRAERPAVREQETDA
jgi:hypothetical protein